MVSTGWLRKRRTRSGASKTTVPSSHRAMKNLNSESKLVAKGIHLPPVILDSRVLGNWHTARTSTYKSALVQAWLDGSSGPVAIETAMKYGAGLALEVLNEVLRQRKVQASEVIAINHLGWYRVPLASTYSTFDAENWVAVGHDAELRLSPEGIRNCWQQYIDLVEEDHRARMLSLHDVMPFLSVARDAHDLARRRGTLVDAYTALQDLTRGIESIALGISVNDRETFESVDKHVPLDWLMVSGIATLHGHSKADSGWLRALADRGITVIEASPLATGDTPGGRGLGESPNIDSRSAHDSSMEWRQNFAALCMKHNVHPTSAYAQFSLMHPAVTSVIMNCAVPERVRSDIALTCAPVPTEFWDDAKASGLIVQEYGYVGSGR